MTHRPTSVTILKQDALSVFVLFIVASLSCLLQLVFSSTVVITSLLVPARYCYVCSGPGFCQQTDCAFCFLLDTG